MDVQITLRVNGRVHRMLVDTRNDTLGRAPRTPRPHGHQERLRSRAVWRVHHPARRAPGTVV